MHRKSELIARKAQEDKGVKFTSLMHYLNEENLIRCFHQLKKNKACGVDEVTLDEYGQGLENNIADLVRRLKTKTYSPKPVLRVYIPKPGKSELRPLGIPCVEDKIVQMAFKEILEPIYEQDFLECSHGFRPKKSCHTTIKQLDDAVMQHPANWVVEVDIRKFFDSVDHVWLITCLKERIADPNIIWLVRKFLKAGIMESGQLHESETGTPQGGVISPLLANIYLHYVLDLWFEKKFKPASKGYVELIRYCDDFVVVCESEHDAKRFLPELEQRLGKFGLVISQEKTRALRFGRYAWKQAQRTGKKVETFDFLGFTHICGKSRKGFFVMQHITSGQRARSKLKETNAWLRDARSKVPLQELWPTIKAKLIGHYNYFGINGNIRAMQKYYQIVVRMIFKWINRRGQKKSMNWKEFQRYLDWNPLPQPRIYHAILY